MLIQCREDLLNLICDYFKDSKPVITEIPTCGYIDCFDKDWVFISIKERPDTKSLRELILKQENAQFLIGIQEKNTIIQRNIDENEQYIFVRKREDNKYELRWGVSSFVIFED